jgi:hypothetical protein
VVLARLPPGLPGHARPVPVVRPRSGQRPRLTPNQRKAFPQPNLEVSYPISLFVSRFPTEPPGHDRGPRVGRISLDTRTQKEGGSLCRETSRRCRFACIVAEGPRFLPGRLAFLGSAGGLSRAGGPPAHGPTDGSRDRFSGLGPRKGLFYRVEAELGAPKSATLTSLSMKTAVPPLRAPFERH